MGGNAFDHCGPNGEPTMVITRLGSQEYRQLKAEVSTILQRFYKDVRTPAEAPEKTSFGDLDLLVEGPLHSFQPGQISAALSAQSERPAHPTTSYAVPFTTADGSDKFAQVDIHICHGSIDWLAQQRAYGDLGQILGHIANPYGISARSHGLFLRIREMEERNWQASMVLLTSNFESYVEFLGLDLGLYRDGFDTLDAIDKWLANCRLLNPGAFQTSAHELRKRNKSIMTSRPMYQRFVDEIIPQLPPRDPASLPTRNDILHEALDRFGRRGEYEERLAQILVENLELKARGLLVDTLKPPGQQTSTNFNRNVNLAVRAVQRHTQLVDGQLRFLAEPQMDESVQLKLRELLDDAEVLEERHREWVKEHFHELKSAEKHRKNENSLAKQKTDDGPSA